MALILSRADVERSLTMAETIAAMRMAFRALYNKTAQAPHRLAVPLPEHGVALYMPSLLQDPDQPPLAGLKVVTSVPGNRQRGLPTLHACVLLLDALTGKTLAVLEGGLLTAMRTGAVSGLATDLLARHDADILALFGAGVQAPMQAWAVHTVRPLREIRVVNHNMERYQQLVATLQRLLGADCPPIHHADSARAALEGASLVCCATPATSPLFSWQEIASGAHINAVGAFTPEMCELDKETLAHARIVVDQREAALVEAGDLLQAVEAGAIAGADSWIELGELIAHDRVVRQTREDVTVFKSVGIGVQDVATAWTVYRNARERGIGVEVEI